ncbi:zinc ABC transporter solute-binding protein|uniref:Zinc ABC transporter solute-binding protein n=1 Tax=Leuconostoc lactis TaxID=1246 RepID=A0A6L7ABE0_LEULA|nr:zinc ABC transporter solute-binding protein [Leuconostoc lactis]
MLTFAKIVPSFDTNLTWFGIVMDNDFSEAIEEGNDPSPATLSALKTAITSHKIAFIVNNKQTTSATVNNIIDLAKANHIPVVNVTVAHYLADLLSKKDPAHKADYQANAKKYIASLQPITDLVTQLKAKSNQQDVAQTEPVFEYMLDALGYRPTTAVAKKVNGTDIVIANGLGYDAWLTKLAKSSPKSQLVEVGEDVLHDKMGQNPHLWNDPNTMIQFVLAVIVIAIVGFAAFKGSETPQKATNKISIITSTDFYAELAQTVVGDHGTATAIIKHDNISPEDYG